MLISLRNVVEEGATLAQGPRLNTQATQIQTEKGGIEEETIKSDVHEFGVWQICAIRQERSILDLLRGTP